MTKVLIAALLGGQILAAQPALAAELAAAEQPRVGAFAGFRVRVALDGDARERPVRAGVALAPTLHSRSVDGESRTRVGEGLEIGVTGTGPVRLSLAGRDLRRLGAAEEGEGRRRGPSTVAWVAIGLAAAVVVTATVGYFWLEDRVDDE